MKFISVDSYKPYALLFGIFLDTKRKCSCKEKQKFPPSVLIGTRTKQNK